MFHLGLQHGAILILLRLVDEIMSSMQTLSRILNRMDYRGRNQSDPLDVVTFLIDQLESHGSHQFHHHGYAVTQGTIRRVITFLDPCGV